MALRESFESTGNWLFRWRGYIPWILVIILLLSLQHYNYLGHSKQLNQIWETFCLLVSFFGLAIRVLTIGYTPKDTSGRKTRKQVADSLNTTGIYSVVRHPLYLGNFFMGLGAALFPHLWWLALIYILVFCVYYERIMFAEEAFLRTRFGDEYMQWSAITPAFIPHFRNYVRPNLAFSARNALKREYNGFFVVIVVLFILAAAETMAAERKFEVDFYWVTILGVGFLVWLVLRTLKKRTKLLNVEGR